MTAFGTYSYGALKSLTKRHAHTLGPRGQDLLPSMMSHANFGFDKTKRKEHRQSEGRTGKVKGG
jgi:hypothetical protein